MGWIWGLPRLWNAEQTLQIVWYRGIGSPIPTAGLGGAAGPSSSAASLSSSALIRVRSASIQYFRCLYRGIS